MFVHKPHKYHDGWRVIITKERNILSERVEVINCGFSREEAWQTYFWAVKNRSLGGSGKKRLVGFSRQDGIEREENDFYATHSSAIPPLLNLLGWNDGVSKKIWENSCGTGHLVKPLKAAGHTVIATDLINRGFGVGGVDFLKPNWFEHEQFDAIVMNPPYKLAQQFVEKSIKIAPLVCAFLKIQFLESQTREEFFNNHPPKIVAVFRNRVPCAKNGDFHLYKSHPVCYAWYIWERGFKDYPQIRWI